MTTLKELIEQEKELDEEEETGGISGQEDGRGRIGKDDRDGLTNKKCEDLLLETVNYKKNKTNRNIKETQKKKLKGMRKNNNDKEIRTTIRL